MILQATSLTYLVPTGFGKYQFTVTSNQFGDITVNNITRDSVAFFGSYPLPVQQAINDAISRLENIVAGVSTLNGSVLLANQSEGSIVFGSPLPNTNYRVVFSIDDFIPVRVKSRTTTGFTFELATAYTGTLRYDILV